VSGLPRTRCDRLPEIPEDARGIVDQFARTLFGDDVMEARQQRANVDLWRSYVILALWLVGLAVLCLCTPPVTVWVWRMAL
jgi:hypothetical protein